MNPSTIVKTSEKNVYIPQDDGLIVYSPIRLSATKYSNEVAMLLGMCSVQTTIESLHRRGSTTGLTGTIEEYFAIITDMHKKGIVYVDGSQVLQVNELKPIIPDPIGSPTSAVVHLTMRCNKRCLYCYNQDFRDSNMHDELSVSEWEKVFNRISDAGIPSVTITGGEPLLRIDVIEMLLNKKQDDHSYGMITNGSLITKNNIGMLSKLFSTITISIDSHEPETADKLRGSGTHASVLNAMDLLASSGVTWSANVVLTKFNIDDYEATYEWLKKKRCPHITPIIQTIKDESNSATHPTVSQIESFLDTRYDNILNPESRIDVITDLEKSKSFLISQKYTCTAAIAECAIDSLGYLYPCRMLMHNKLRSRENLLDTEFSSIWQKDTVLNSVRNRAMLPDECTRCEYYSLCAGECHGHRLLKSGDFMESTSLEMCTVIKQIITKKIIANIHFAQKNAKGHE
jgi:radical SAM protein with 4Fe4S-binding SPASM domain